MSDENMTADQHRALTALLPDDVMWSDPLMPHLLAEIIHRYDENRGIQQMDERDRLRAENQTLRRMLAFAVCPTLYTDDGELQDNSTLPYIDFKRDAAAEIAGMLVERGRAAVASARAGEKK